MDKTKPYESPSTTCRVLAWTGRKTFPWALCTLENGDFADGWMMGAG